MTNAASSETSSSTYNLIFGGSGNDSLSVDFNDTQVLNSYKTWDNSAYLANVRDADNNTINQIFFGGCHFSISLDRPLLTASFLRFE
jgi:hypothetical protein